MTFPVNIPQVTLKDTTADELVSPRFYANGADFNDIFANLLGIETQLGASPKMDITASGNQISFAGSAQLVIGGVIVPAASGSVLFGAAGVTFVWVDQLGVIQNGVALPVVDNYLPLAQVTTGVGGIVLSWVDLRPWLTGTGGGGGGSFPSAYRNPTSQRRYSRRDVIVLANTDFLPALFIPLTDSAWFYIDVVSDTTATLTLFQIEAATNSMILGTMVAGVEKRFIVQAPKRYDGSAIDIQYQLQSSLGAVIDFITIMEVQFDALLTSTPAVAGLDEIPFSVPFTFATGSPLLLFTMLAGDVLTEVEVVIETPFDSVTSTLRVGIATDLSLVLGTDEIDPDIIGGGQFASELDYTSPIVDALILSIVPGTATVGSGYVAGVIRR